MGNGIIAVVGYGTSISFALASALGFFGSLVAKPESKLKRHALGWWFCGAVLALLFAAVTRGLLGVCAP
ncbi:hypothetical protein ACQKQD_18945 [Methylobacterium sp. NPDC080182]|uniref:hypothetical protein n=1 Tax=Methylobacterium sp. NPDC080182 TaxID=3390590 RepID=UPI003D08E25D